jgi:hypothetical protein
MADYLVYWQSFWDADRSAWEGPLKEWWSRDTGLFNGAGHGDTLWVVTTAGETAPSEWRLLSAVRLLRKEAAAEKHPRYGQYHFIGDGRRSLGFDISAQPDFAAVLRLVRFDSGRRITRVGRPIGQLLQKPRRLAAADSVLLAEYASTLTDREAAT